MKEKSNRTQVHGHKQTKTFVVIVVDQEREYRRVDFYLLFVDTFPWMSHDDGVAFWTCVCACMYVVSFVLDRFSLGRDVDVYVFAKNIYFRSKTGGHPYATRYPSSSHKQTKSNPNSYILLTLSFSFMYRLWWWWW